MDGSTKLLVELRFTLQETELCLGFETCASAFQVYVIVGRKKWDLVQSRVLRLSLGAFLLTTKNAFVPIDRVFSMNTYS